MEVTLLHLLALAVVPGLVALYLALGRLRRQVLGMSAEWVEVREPGGERRRVSRWHALGEAERRALLRREQALGLAFGLGVGLVLVLGFLADWLPVGHPLNPALRPGSGLRWLAAVLLAFAWGVAGVMLAAGVGGAAGWRRRRHGSGAGGEPGGG